MEKFYPIGSGLGMVTVATITVDEGLGYAINKLKTQVSLLKLFGNRRGMNNKVENLTAYGERIERLLQIQKARQ